MTAREVSSEPELVEALADPTTTAIRFKSADTGPIVLSGSSCSSIDRIGASASGTAANPIVVTCAPGTWVAGPPSRRRPMTTRIQQTCVLVAFVAVLLLLIVVTGEPAPTVGPPCPPTTTGHCP